MRLRTEIRAALTAALTILFLVGCDDAPKTAAKPKIKTRETINKWTDQVRNLQPELDAGGQVADQKLKSTDYITIQGEAYRNTVAKMAIMSIDQAMMAYEIENNSYPKTYDEFMDNIMKRGKPDAVRLPMLPFYQEYGYDVANHKLVVIEYPAKKAEQKRQQDEELGRN